MSEAIKPPRSDSRSVLRQLVQLSLPIIGLNVLSVLALTVDTGMCGRLPNAKAALTALGFATQIAYVMIIFVMGLTIGCASLAARAHGARQHERVERVLGQGVLLTAFVSLAVAVVGNLLGPAMLRALGAHGEVADLAMDYLSPLMTCIVFQYMSLLFASVLRGLGNTRLPFFIAIVVNVANFVLNYGLILGNYGLPALGVRGAAYGTVIAYGIGMVIYVALLLRGTATGVRLRLSALLPERELVSSITRIGTPAALDMAIFNVSFLSIVGMLGRIEQVAVGAHGLGLRIQGLSYVPGFAVSQATAALVGQALGAEDVAAARSVTKTSVAVCTALMSALALAIVLAAYPIVAAFDVTSGSRLEALSVEWIRQLGYCMPLVGVFIAYVGALQGAGDTASSLLINLVATIFFQVPLSWVLGYPVGWGVIGVWVAFPVSFVLKVFLAWWVYRRGNWARVGV